MVSHFGPLRSAVSCGEVNLVANDENPDSVREEPAPYRRPPETQRLIDELYREEVVEARAMRPEDKFLAGEDLFNYACRITLAGIRNQHPDLDEEGQRRVLEERIALGERLKELS